MPDVVNLVDGELCLDLRERVPVAIVIVARVLVIELGRISSFVRRAESFVVPVLDDVDAIGIQRRHQQDDRVVENVLNLRVRLTRRDDVRSACSRDTSQPRSSECRK